MPWPGWCQGLWKQRQSGRSICCCPPGCGGVPSALRLQGTTEAGGMLRAWHPGLEAVGLALSSVLLPCVLLRAHSPVAPCSLRQGEPKLPAC